MNMIEHKFFAGNPAAFLVWKHALQYPDGTLCKRKIKGSLRLTTKQWRTAASFLRRNGLMAEMVVGVGTRKLFFSDELPRTAEA